MEHTAPYDNSPSYMEGPRILVIQTGKMREQQITKGVDSLANARKSDGEAYIDPDFVIHRFLPQDLEAKYEAIDFADKFGLTYQPHFNIFDSDGGNVQISGATNQGFMGWGYPQGDMLLDKVNVVVAIGSTSVQAFKLTHDGPVCILPMTDEARANPSIIGNKEDTNLTASSLATLSSTKDPDVACSVLNFVRENSGDSGNVLLVNQIGYSILGFNPRGKNAAPHVPTKEQKVVSVRDYEEFTDNGGKTGLITVFQDILRRDIETNSNVFVIARQCKAKVGYTEHDISGQWANQAIRLVNEPSLKLPTGVSFDTVVDLGGSSGSSYSLENPAFGGWLPFSSPPKYIRDKSFMNTPSKLDFMKEKGFQPNDFADCVDAFVGRFNRELEDVYDDLSRDAYSSDE